MVAMLYSTVLWGDVQCPGEGPTNVSQTFRVDDDPGGQRPGPIARGGGDGGRAWIAWSRWRRGRGEESDDDGHRSVWDRQQWIEN